MRERSVLSLSFFLLLITLILLFQWLNGKRDGKGICQYAHSVYEGEWKQNLKHGYGKITYAGHPSHTA
jgi:hypothetical protein